jgi:hypothetical protein
MSDGIGLMCACIDAGWTALVWPGGKDLISCAMLAMLHVEEQAGVRKGTRDSKPPQ